jgi:hypothetical protein
MDTVVTFEGKWLGACPAGRKPGDMEGPDGKRENVMDVAEQSAVFGAPFLAHL